MFKDLEKRAETITNETREIRDQFDHDLFDWIYHVLGITPLLRKVEMRIKSSDDLYRVKETLINVLVEMGIPRAVLMVPAPNEKSNQAWISRLYPLLRGEAVDNNGEPILLNVRQSDEFGNLNAQRKYFLTIDVNGDTPEFAKIKLNRTPAVASKKGKSDSSKGNGSNTRYVWEVINEFRFTTDENMDTEERMLRNMEEGESCGLTTNEQCVVMLMQMDEILSGIKHQ